MSSTFNVPEKHTCAPGDIVKAARLDPEEFYANIFALRNMQIQQSEVQSIIPIDQTSNQTQSLPIGLIVEDANDYEERDNLGKNLLDSFALIFAQHGPEGVVATAMNRDDTEPHVYTLLVAKNYSECCSLTELFESIEGFFTAGVLCDGCSNQVDTKIYQDKLWCAIVRNCYPSICKEIYRACRVPRKPYYKGTFCDKEIRNNFLETRACIKSADRPSPAGKMSYEADGLLSILDHIYLFFSNNLNVHTNKRNPGWKNDDQKHESPHSKPASNELINLLYKITQLCFKLLESHRESMSKLFHKCFAEFIQDDQEERNKWLNKLRRLIYIIANYRRAWYDIIRFKTHHRTSILRIKVVTQELVTCSMTLKCIANAGIQMGILEEGQEEETFIERYSNFEAKQNADLEKAYQGYMDTPEPESLEFLRKEEAWVSLWMHCEMQILEKLLHCQCHDPHQFNYIGCSKSPCWLCHHALKKMTSKFEMRDPHLKLYPGWKPPTFKDNNLDRGRFVKVLQFLDRQVSILVRSELAERRKNRQRISTRILPDCPDIEKTFLSPRTEQMRQSEAE